MGEHVETHMFLGSFQRQKSIAGFVEKNCAQPLSLLERHDALAAEMVRRGYNHKSPLQFAPEVLNYLPESHRNATVDIDGALHVLLVKKACPVCIKRYNFLKELDEKSQKQVSEQEEECEQLLLQIHMVSIKS
jgi:hypothetical protein